MFGTKDGYWFAFIEIGDDRLDYEFFCYETRIDNGVCGEEEMFKRFDALRTERKTDM